MSAGLPNRPSFLPQEQIDRFRARWARDAILEPYGPKPPGRQPRPTPKRTARECDRLIAEAKNFRADFERQRRAAAAKKERERILYGSKPTLEQRLAAIPPPTYTPIAPKPVLLNFEKLTSADLARIFQPKIDATLKRFNVFETLQCFRTSVFVLASGFIHHRVSITTLQDKPGLSGWAGVEDHLIRYDTTSS